MTSTLPTIAFERGPGSVIANHESSDPRDPVGMLDTLDRIVARHSGPVPLAVVIGMFVAAWARAEHCPVYAFRNGEFDLYAKYNPSDELAEAFARYRAAVVGCVGWALPTVRPKPSELNRLVTFIAPPWRFERD